MKAEESDSTAMNTPGFTAESSCYPRQNIYQAGRGFGHEPVAASVVPQRLGHTCVGRYCDCEGVADCVDMINRKCGNWTRCLVIGGVLRCLCEPRFSIRI
jgi:hypothetical protein